MFAIIIKLLCMCGDYTCFFAIISPGAVHRYYESRRRLFNDIQPGRLHIARETRKKSRNKARRKLV